MRGKGVPIVIKRLTNGITPAYAGKSMGYNQRRLGYGDHPRLCGEKLKASYDEQKAQGSPPPMRGKGIR